MNVIGSSSQKKEGATKAENGESGATKSEPAAVVETAAPIASVAQGQSKGVWSSPTIVIYWVLKKVLQIYTLFHIILVDSAELKSDVSQVYEIAMRRNLPVEFEVSIV